MKLEDAVILRIEQLCIERNMTKYDLFKASGVPQSTLTSIKKKDAFPSKLAHFTEYAKGLIFPWKISFIPLCLIEIVLLINIVK